MQKNKQEVPCKNHQKFYNVRPAPLMLANFLLSPAFSKKSGGTLFLVFRGAWCMVRGAWCMVCGAWRVVRGSEFLVGTLSP